MAAKACILNFHLVESHVYPPFSFFLFFFFSFFIIIIIIIFYKTETMEWQGNDNLSFIFFFFPRALHTFCSEP